jgi:phosphoribosyl-dephospho-CoA transferase
LEIQPCNVEYSIWFFIAHNQKLDAVLMIELKVRYPLGRMMKIKYITMV